MKILAIRDRGKKTLHHLIRDNVVPGTTVITDSLQAYVGLDKFYNHIIVKAKKGKKARVRGIKPDRELNTNSIENVWSTYKKGMEGTYHRVKFKNLQRYNEEFAFRRNTLDKTQTEKFQIALGLALGQRLKYKKLSTKPEKWWDDYTTARLKHVDVIRDLPYDDWHDGIIDDEIERLD